MQLPRTGQSVHDEQGSLLGEFGPLKHPSKHARLAKFLSGAYSTLLNPNSLRYACPIQKWLRLRSRYVFQTPTKLPRRRQLLP